MENLPNNKLHIVCFDVPDPPDYGGAIDIYYKITALAELGVEVYLHCFAYGRKHSAKLENICAKVWYYDRKTGLGGVSLRLPYIVSSRKNEDLLHNLKGIDAPILFEGVHTTYYLSHPDLKHRIKAVRNHNIEHDYYLQLYKKEKSLAKRLYFLAESMLLKKYEQQMYAAQFFFPLSMADTLFFERHYPKAKHQFIGPFHPYNEIDIKPGTWKYCLYHGNLSHPENEEAVLFLIKEVFPTVKMPIIIAGKNPSEKVITAVKTLKDCRLLANPSGKLMQQLLRDAHINVLPTFQATGMKLKLLHALFASRHVIVNREMIYGTGLEDCCIVAETASDFTDKINEYNNVPFTDTDIQLRKDTLMKHYSNGNNAVTLLTYLLR